jgi:hypothetical protein
LNTDPQPWLSMFVFKKPGKALNFWNCVLSVVTSLFVAEKMSRQQQREQDPLDPENDIFWDPELLLKRPPPPPPPEPEEQQHYRLKPVNPAPQVSRDTEGNAIKYFVKIFFWGIYYFFTYYIQHCLICRPSDSTVPTDAGIEPRTVAPVHWQHINLLTVG